MISGSVGKAVDCKTDHEARCWGSNPRRGTFPFCLYLLLSKSQSGQQTNSDSSFPSWNTIGTEIEIKLLLNCLWREYRLNFQLKIVKNNVPLYTVPARWIFEFNAVAIANMAGNETWLAVSVLLLLWNKNKFVIASKHQREFPPCIKSSEIQRNSWVK